MTVKKTSDAQKRATREYRQKNKELTKIQSYRSSAKTFIRNYATLVELEELENEINARKLDLKTLINQIEQQVKIGKLDTPFTTSMVKELGIKKDDGTDYADSSINSILSNSSRSDSSNLNREVLRQSEKNGVKYYEFI